MCRIILVGLCFLMAQSASAEIYTWTDENGTLHFGDRPAAVAGQVSEEAEEAIDAPPRSTTSMPITGGIVMKMRRLLRQQRFDELNRILGNYQAACESDISTEPELFTAYAGFGFNDPSYEPLLSAWIAATPDKYMPYVARARYYCQMGWVSRGTRWSTETAEAQLQAMHSYFEKSIKDIEAALAINDQCMVPYGLAIEVATGLGRGADAAAVAEKALQIAPASYKVRARYMWALTPRWGGSYEMMLQFAEASQAYVSKNPELERLKGAVYDEAADMYVIARQYSKAEELYTKALAYGESHLTLKNRGENRRRRNDYEDALRDLNRAIELAPEIGEYYYCRSTILTRMNRLEQALADIEQADKLSPNHPNIRKHHKYLAYEFTQKGHDLQKNVDPANAVEQYTSALRLAPDDAQLYYRRARARIEQNDFPGALDDLKQSIERDPHDINAYLLIDYVLAKGRDWSQIIRYWDRYISLHPNNGRAYAERGGAYFHKGDMRAAIENAKIAADLGNREGREAYEKFKHLVE